MTYRITTEHAARCAARRDVARCARLGVDPVAEVTRPPEVTIAPSLRETYVTEALRLIDRPAASPPPTSMECPLCRGMWTGDLRASHRVLGWESCLVVYSGSVARLLAFSALGDYEPLAIRLRRYARAIGEVST